MPRQAFSNYYRIAGGGLANLNDGSHALMAEFAYDAFDNLRLALGALLFFGPDGSEFNGEYFLGEIVDLMRSALYVKCKMSF